MKGVFSDLKNIVRAYVTGVMRIRELRDTIKKMDEFIEKREETLPPENTYYESAREVRGRLHVLMKIIEGDQV
jgi:hypothetical protein